eukprot:437904_1
MALEIVQESIQKQEEKRKFTQHEFYVHELFSVKSQKIFKASTVHHVNQSEEDYSTENDINVTKHEPVTSFNNDDIGFKHQNSANTIANMSSIHDDDKIRSITDNANISHLRSRSDNQMIKDIANQIVLHTKHVKSKLKSEPIPKPKLNAYATSEQDIVTPNKLPMKKRATFETKNINPSDIIDKKKYHSKYQPLDEEVFDIYENIRGIERSPSLPPNSMFHENNNINVINTNESNSIFQTFRSWITPVQKPLPRGDISLFLKMQGFNENEEESEEENDSNVPIDHGAFNINVNGIDIKYLDDLTSGITPNINDNNQEKNNEIDEIHLTTPVPMGHMIINVDPIGDNFNIHSHNGTKNDEINEKNVKYERLYDKNEK